MIVFPFNSLFEFETNGYRTRDGHIIRSLSKKNIKILIIYRPIVFWKIIFEKFYLKKFGRLKFCCGKLCIIIKNDNNYHIVPISFRFYSVLKLRKRILPQLYSDISGFCSDFIAKNCNSSGYKILHFSPLSINASGKITYKKTEIFDGIDNLALHPTYKNQYGVIIALYKQSIERCKLVQFNSSSSVLFFKNLFPEYKDKIKFSRNRVDVKKFTDDSVELKSDVDILYIGKIQEMFDVELVKFLVSKLPNRQFFIVGPELKYNHLRELKDKENVYIIGNVSHAEAICYYKSANIFIIPYDVSKQHGGDPIKFYEAFICGLPIVTTNIGDISDFADLDGVFIVNDKQEFWRSIENSDRQPDNREDFHSKLDWDSLAESISDAY